MRAMIAILAVLFLGLQSPAAVEGQQEARRDIAAGKLILRAYGLMGPSAYPKILQEKYGIRLERVAGCVVDANMVAKTGAYNAVMKAEIEKRFGRGVLEAASAAGGAVPRQR